MKKRNLLLVILAVLLVFGMVMSCGPAEEEDPNAPAKLSSATADGSATVTSTKIDLKFSKAVTGLTATDITLTGAAAASVTKGSLTGSGTSWSLALTTVTGGGKVTVAVAGVDGTKEATINWVDPFAAYYQDFYVNYGKKADNSPITETLSITKAKIRFQDNDKGVGAAADFLEFTIDSDGWKDGGTVPTSITSVTTPFTGSSYTKAVVLKGKITGAKPDGTVAADGVYGPTTCPGIVKADINTTTVYLYLYFAPDTSDPEGTKLLRSAFSKTAPTTPPAKVSNRDEYRVQ